MPVDSLSTFLQSLHDSQLLSQRQWQQVEEELQVQFPRVGALAQELVRRRWLTEYQANEVNRRRARDLFVGDYLLLEPLGGGGMGQVFRARHRKMGRVEALKVIRQDLLDNPTAAEQLTSRFQRELEATARLSHPNIVQVHNAGEDRGRPFMVMEYLEGIDLERLVKETGPLPLAQACAYVSQTAQGLQHLHEHGMVHRDIKPRNLLVTTQHQQVKILDLGLVLFVRGEDNQNTAAELTRCVQVMGTRPYMAPEQLIDPHGVDIRADLYSLGCTFYFLLTGQVRGGGPGQLQPLEALRPEVPAPLAAVVERLLAPRAEDRYQTPAELVAALAPFLDTHPVVSQAVVNTPAQKPPPPASTDGHTTPFSHGDTVTAPQSAVLSGRRRWLVPVVVSVSAGLLLLGACLATGLVVASLSWLAVRRAPGDQQAVRPTQRTDEVVVAHPGAGPGPIGPLPKFEADPAPSRPVPAEEAGALGPSPLLAGHQSGVTGVAFLPDGVRAISCSIQDIILWDLRQGKKVQRYSLMDSPFGEGPRGFPDIRPGVPNREALEEMMRKNQKAAQGLRMAREFCMGSVAVTPDGRRVLIGCPNILSLWDVDEWKRIQITGDMDGGSPHCYVAVSPGGSRALFANQHDQITFWKLDPLEEIPGLSCPGHVACFFADGRRVLVGQALREPGVASLGVFDLQKKDFTSKFPAHSSEVSSVAVSPDGRHALSAGGRAVVFGDEQDNDVFLWDLEAGTKKELKGHTKRVTTVAISPDGRRGLSGSDDTTVRLWDLESGQLLETFSLHDLPVTCVAFSPGGRHALSGSEDKTVRLWELPR